MWSSYGKSFTKLILLDGARRVEIKGVLPEVSTLGEGRLRTQENGAFREALDDETIPDKYCRWKLSKPDTRNEVNAIERPMAQIENVASDDQGNAHGDFTARFGQHSFMYRLKHVADAKQGDEVFLPVDVPGFLRVLRKNAQWYKVVSSISYDKYELQLDVSDGKISLATITCTPFELFLDILNDRGHNRPEYVSDDCCNALFAECPGKKLEGFAQPSKSVFIEAALVSLFISRRQYSSLIPKNVLGDRIVLCPDEVTNAKLPTIFRQPDKPIFGEILTFTLGPEGARVRPDPWYNLMFCNYDKEVKVVGLWGDNPVLFEFQEKEVKFNGISLRKLEKLENGFQYDGEIQGTKQRFFFTMAYQKEKKPGPFNFTIKFGDKEADFDSLNAKAGIQMLQAGILAMVRVLNPQHRPVPEDSLTK